MSEYTASELALVKHDLEIFHRLPNDVKQLKIMYKNAMDQLTERHLRDPMVICALCAKKLGPITPNTKGEVR